MTLQPLTWPLIWPGLTVGLTGFPAQTAGDTLDAAGEYTAVGMSAPYDFVATHIGFKAQAVTGSPTAVASIQAVAAATGAPSGDWATNTNVTTATLTTTFALHALTASATILKGQMFAVKIMYNSGTSFNVSTALVSSSGPAGLPYRVTNVTGSPVKSACQGMDICIGTSASTFIALPWLLPCAAFVANAFNNTSSAKRGIRFKAPFKCTVSGCRIYQGVLVGDYAIQIEDDAGSILSSSDTVIEGDISSALGTATNNVHFDNVVTLSPATWYRLAVVPQSATNINMYTATLPNSDPNYAQAWPGGANFYYSTFTTSTWTDAPTSVPFIDLLLSHLDDGLAPVDPGATGIARVMGG